MAWDCENFEENCPNSSSMIMYSQNIVIFVSRTLNYVNNHHLYLFKINYSYIQCVFLCTEFVTIRDYLNIFFLSVMFTVVIRWGFFVAAKTTCLWSRRATKRLKPCQPSFWRTIKDLLRWKDVSKFSALLMLDVNWKTIGLWLVWKSQNQLLDS